MVGPCISPATCAGATPCRSSRAWCPTPPLPWTRASAAAGGLGRAGRRLTARVRSAGRDRVGPEDWAARANGVRGPADTAAAEGRYITAGHHYMRAGNYYYSAERFILPGTEKMAMYRKALRAYHAA